MTERATGGFEAVDWQEEALDLGGGGGALTRARVAHRFTGDLEGDGLQEGLQHYGAVGTARFVGLQRVEGRLGGRAGAFVLEVAGEYGGAGALGTWRVLEGSGEGALQGLRGEGRFEAADGRRGRWSLEWELDG